MEQMRTGLTSSRLKFLFFFFIRNKETSLNQRRLQEVSRLTRCPSKHRMENQKQPKTHSQQYKWLNPRITSPYHQKSVGTFYQQIRVNYDGQTRVSCEQTIRCRSTTKGGKRKF